MSDEEYTPNIDDVRSRYVFYASELTDDFDEKKAEFDRWLNEQLARAWAEGHGAPPYRTNLSGDYLGPMRNPYRKADS